MHIFDGTRLERVDDVLDRHLDSVAFPFLIEIGFVESSPYCFRRSDALGSDVAFFNVTHRDICVRLSRMLESMSEIDALYEDDHFPGEPQLGVYSILTPSGVFSGSSFTFKTKKAARRDKSLEKIAQSLESYGPPWWATHADPAKFAQGIDPNALMYFARAHEVIGQRDVARTAYREMLDRLHSCRELHNSDRDFVVADGYRTLIYLCLKLQQHENLCALAMSATGFRPTVDPL